MYIDKLDDIINKYNNTFHITIKLKPVDVKSRTYIDSSKENNEKYPKFILVILSEYQNIKIFLQKGPLQIDLKKFSWFEKWKIFYPGLMLLIILMERKFLEHFTKKNCKKQIKKSLKLKKVI